jgi:hypothetical protein
MFKVQCLPLDLSNGFRVQRFNSFRTLYFEH